MYMLRCTQSPALQTLMPSKRHNLAAVKSSRLSATSKPASALLVLRYVGKADMFSLPTDPTAVTGYKQRNTQE